MEENFKFFNLSELSSPCTAWHR